MKNVGKTGVDRFVGNWTYRSFINTSELDAPADKVLFAIAIELKLEVEDTGGLSPGLAKGDISAGLDIGCTKLNKGCGRVSGRVSFGQDYLTVSGAAKPGDPPIIRFRGTGAEGTYTDGWIYDYIGYLAPSWPKGPKWSPEVEGQRPAILGTVVRTVPHKAQGPDGTEVVRPAGVTLSFIAVLRDDPVDS